MGAAAHLVAEETRAQPVRSAQDPAKQGLWAGPICQRCLTAMPRHDRHPLTKLLPTLGLRGKQFPARSSPFKGFNMLRYAVIFIVIALIAAVFGFGGIASSAAGIAQILFVVFLILAVGTFLFGRRK